MSTNKSIARASLFMMIASLGVSALSLGKEMLVARSFGLSGAMDAYYAGTTLPVILSGMTAAVLSVFLPVFVACRKRSDEEAKRVASIMMTDVLVIFGAVSILAAAASPLIVRVAFHGLDPLTGSLASKVLAAIAVMVPLSALIAIVGGILNTYQYFAAPVYTQSFITVITIALLFLAGGAGVFTLVFGTIAGMILQLAWLYPLLARNGFRFRWEFNLRHPAIRETFSASALFLIAVAASNITVIIDRAMASHIAPGSIAVLGYADKLIQACFAVFAGSIATAVFPHFSSQAAESRTGALTESLVKTVRMLAFILLPVTAAILALSRPMIALLFERGAFTSASTAVVAPLLGWYSLQLFFYTAFMVLVKLCLALRDSAAIIRITLFGLCLKVLLNLTLTRVMNPPVSGIALSTSLTAMVWAGYLLVTAGRHLPELRFSEILRPVGKILLLSAAAGSVMYGIAHSAALASSGNVVQATVALTSGAVVFFALALLSRIPEAAQSTVHLRDMVRRIT